jgi:hypothetical protein
MEEENISRGRTFNEGIFAFVLLESGCWYTTGWERFGVNNEETSDMRVNQEFKIRIVGKFVG